MLLEGALAARSIQNTKMEDPKDRKYNQLLEEMRLAEGTFAHTLKEIELRDRRISNLEDDLEKSKRRNELLRHQLDLAQGNQGRPDHPRATMAGHRDHGRTPRLVVGPSIVISFRACPTLTSFLPNPNNAIGMFQSKHFETGSSH